MSLAHVIVSRFRLTITASLLFALVGLASWMTMPRQEDPTMPYRAATIVVPYPGADAESVERLVVQPLEERLAQVDEIDVINATARANVAVLVVQLREDVLEGVDRAWDDVERKIELARVDFPDAVGVPEFDRDIFDQESIVIAVHASADVLALRDAAHELEARLLRLPTVSRVILSADPGEQIVVELDAAASRRLGIDPRTLAGLLQRRNAAIPGGTIEVGGRTLTVRPNAEFRSVEEIQATPIPLASGASVPLHEIATVRRAPEQPASALMRLDGDRSVALGVVPRQGINVLAFGEQVDALVQEYAAEIAPLKLDYMAFQPTRVEARLTSLGRSLLSGVGIVALVVVLLMGLRLGLTVASVVPVVAMASVAIYAMGGGVLHQMSIAAVVLALGLLVDNAIVMAENVQARLDDGVERWEAARRAVSELALPLGAATGTTLASFVPMLLAEGATGDFTRALPIVIMVTLTVSYVVAITVTPALSALTLRPRRVAGPGRGAGLLDRLANVSVRHPWLVLLAVVAMIVVAVAQVSQVRLQFFPASDRNQVIVDVSLPEGTHVSVTSETSARIEQALLEREDVTSVAAFVGRGVPHFYYNLVQKPQRPHLAQLVVTTRSTQDVAAVLEGLRDAAREVAPGVEVIGRRIEQGPPVTAPVELRLYGADLEDLREATEQVLALVREAPGAVDARHTLGLGAPSLEFDVNDAAALRHGVARDDVALALLGATRGIDAGQYRVGDDPAPILVRGPDGEQTTVAELGDADVNPPGQRAVPVAQVAQFDVTWRPASVSRRNGQRVASVLAQLEDGATYSDVMAYVGPRLADIELPPTVRWEVGGDAEGSGDANAALLRTLPIGVLLLLLFLMGEFNSFRGVAIVMTTVPLAAVGIIPGLAWSGQPFGFMSMLGVFALIGIVVNNAIVLLDVIQRRREEGGTIADAIRAAVSARTRPILLTTATTVAGLMPLAVSPSTFWPPLALSMISGLLASTALTLFAVPALYRLLYRDA